MNERKVKKFKNQQKRLAQKIAMAHGNTDFSITYEQKVTSTYTMLKAEKVIVRDTSQCIFPAKIIYGKSNKLIVVMHFQGKYNAKKIGKILKRYFWIKSVQNGFEVRSSFNHGTIAKLLI